MNKKTMTDWEAYAELRIRLDHINELVRQAQVFARQYDLLMGTLKYSPETFAVNKPESMEEDFISSNCYGEPNEDFDPERFISSSVCW